MPTLTWDSCFNAFSKEVKVHNTLIGGRQKGTRLRRERFLLPVDRRPISETPLGGRDVSPVYIQQTVISISRRGEMTVLGDITFLCTRAFVLKGGPQHWAFLWAGSVQVPRVADWASPGGEALLFRRGQRPDDESLHLAECTLFTCQPPGIIKLLYGFTHSINTHKTTCR